MAKIYIMSAEIDAHITKKYEIKKRLGKGVSPSFTSFYHLARCAPYFFSGHRLAGISSIVIEFIAVYRLMESSGKL